MIITLEQYAGPYLHHVDFTLERRSNAIDLLAAVNAVLALALADGVPLQASGNTRCLVGGTGNGGFRPQSCPIGAPNSDHKTGRAVDVYETIGRQFARWCLRNVERLEAAGIRSMENPQWTPTWVHLSTVSKSRFVFIPDSSAPKAPPLPEQGGQ